MKAIMMSAISLILICTASLFAQCKGEVRMPNLPKLISKFGIFDTQWSFLANYNDELEHNLAVLSEGSCEFQFPRSFELCHHFRKLNSTLTRCDLQTLSDADDVRFIIDAVTERERKGHWMILVAGGFAGSQYKKSVHELVGRCSSELNEEAYMSSPSVETEKLSHLNQLIDFKKECANPKFFLNNARVSRKDVESLQCAIEVIRRLVDNPNVPNILLKGKTLDKLRKIMGLASGSSCKGNEVGDQFMEDVVVPCNRFIEHSPIYKAALLYRLVPLRDAYFSSIPSGSKFFDLLQTALICKEIAKNNQEIRKKLSASSMFCGK